MILREGNQGKFGYTPVAVSVWTSNYIPMVYADVITYPLTKFNDGLMKFC